MESQQTRGESWGSHGNSLRAWGGEVRGGQLEISGLWPKGRTEVGTGKCQKLVQEGAAKLGLLLLRPRVKVGALWRSLMTGSLNWLLHELHFLCGLSL